jgi:hypothetical protein
MLGLFYFSFVFYYIYDIIYGDKFKNKKGGTKMISFNLPPLALLGRIGSLILTAWLYLLFVLMTARYSRSALKFMLQMFLPILAVVLSRWFGFFPAIILWILYVFLSLPVREEPELKFMGMVLFGLSLIPINIFIKMLVAL